MIGQFYATHTKDIKKYFLHPFLVTVISSELSLQALHQFTIHICTCSMQ